MARVEVGGGLGVEGILDQGGGRLGLELSDLGFRVSCLGFRSGIWSS